MFAPPAMAALHLLKAFPQVTSQALIASPEEPIGSFVSFLQSFTHWTSSITRLRIFFCSSQGSGLLLRDYWIKWAERDE